MCDATGQRACDHAARYTKDLLYTVVRQAQIGSPNSYKTVIGRDRFATDYTIRFTKDL